MANISISYSTISNGSHRSLPVGNQRKNNGEASNVSLFGNKISHSSITDRRQTQLQARLADVEEQYLYQSV